MTVKVLFLFLMGVIGCSWSSRGIADALATTTSTTSSISREDVGIAQAMCEWLLKDGRFTSTAVEPCVVDANDQSPIQIIVTRNVARGEILFKLNKVWSAHDSYNDKDMGPKFRDLYSKAGPGFGVVALSGVVAGERIRRYRSIEGMGTAPESTGRTVPSKFGAFARYLWAKQQQQPPTMIDESLLGTIQMGVNLLVPLLDTVGRRAWSSSAADAEAEKAPAFLSEAWAQKAMFDDGSAMSWSRSELEEVAMKSFELVLNQQRPPPSCIISSKVGSLIPEPYIVDDAPETWPDGEELALVPLVDELITMATKTQNILSSNDNDEEEDDGISAINSVLGSPTPGKSKDTKGNNDCLWCVATRDLKAGDRVFALDPWQD